MIDNMRIFEVLAGQATLFAEGNIWLRNLYDPLVDMGHEVYLMDLSEFSPKANNAFDRGKLSQALIERFYQEHIKKSFDVFFSYLRDDMVDPGAIDEIRRTGVPTVNFSCNNTHQFYLVQDISSHFDYNAHMEKNVSDKFTVVGAKPIWFPAAANPKFYKTCSVPRIMDVSFIGSIYATRPYYIGYLLDNDVNIQVYGPGWHSSPKRKLLHNMKRYLGRNRRVLQAAVAVNPQQRVLRSARLAYFDFVADLRSKYESYLHSPVSDSDMVCLYSQSHINLSFSEVFDPHRPYISVLHPRVVHLRDFEVPMSGGLLLTAFSDELAEFYEPDDEVLVYRGKQELLDKVRFYLANPKQAEGVRNAGFRRAIECHTYYRRFSELFRAIGLNLRVP